MDDVESVPSNPKGPHYRFAMDDMAIHEEVFRLLHFALSHTAVASADRERILTLWR